ncbi:hypothetical protein [Actinocorallia longicatena]|uniref:Mce-associated membrane protein n=1 Tax=Actinocorallia longicatena TaxID=111803 RepID=A0ABP6QE61_9ACTN
MTSVLVVAVLVGAALLIAPASKIWSSSDQDRRDEALGAARQVALNMVTMNYDTVNADVQRVLSGATGSFKDQWAGQTKTLGEELTKNQSKSQGSVLSAGVVSIDDDSAEVIVAVTSVVTNPEVPSGAARNLRFRMSLVKEHGKWLVSDFAMVR